MDDPPYRNTRSSTGSQKVDKTEKCELTDLTSNPSPKSAQERTLKETKSKRPRPRMPSGQIIFFYWS